MSAVKVRELFALLGLEVDKSSFDQGEKAIENIKSLLAAIVGGATLAAGAIGFLTGSFTKQALELDRWKRLTGESIENLDALRIASEQLGFDSEKTFEGMSELADKITDVVKNVKKLEGSDSAEALKNLGFKSVNELKKANGEIRALPDLFDDVLTRLNAVDNEAVRTGLAMQLFGDDTGLALAALDADQLRKFKREAIELGLVMSREDVAAAKAFREQTSGLTTTVQALVFKGLRPMVVGLTSITKWMRGWISANRDLIKMRLGAVFEVIKKAVTQIALKTRDYVKVVLGMVEAMGGAKRVAQILGVTFGVVLARQVGLAAIAIGSRLVAALRSASVASLLLSAQALLIGAVLLGAALIVDEVITTLQGGDTLLSDFIEKFDGEGDPNENFWVKVARKIAHGLREAVRWGREMTELLTVGKSPFTSPFRGVTVDDPFAGASKNDPIAPVLSRIWQAVRNSGALENVAGPLALPAAGLNLEFSSPLSLPPSVPPLAGGPVTITAPTSVEVHVESGADPDAIADRVSTRVREEQDRMIREAARRLQGGGG